MKRLIQFQSLVFASILSGRGTGNCEPSPAFQTLINEPVSLFSFGMFQLNNELHRAILEVGAMPELPPDHQKFEAGVQYNWDKSQLTITIYDFRSEADKEQDPEQDCRPVLAAVRDFLMVDNKTGKARLKSSSLKDYFSPDGYSMTALNDKLFSELDANTVIAFHYTAPGVAGGFSCEGQLLDTGYSVKKQ